MIKEIEERHLAEIKRLRREILNMEKFGLCLSVFLCSTLLMTGVSHALKHDWFFMTADILCFAFNARLGMRYWKAI